MVLRLAEQYLIRSEARAMQSNFEGALQDINQTRSRAGLTDVDLDNTAELLTAIEKERRIELFSEWGHRWLDLKRLNRADAVLSIFKASNWNSTDIFYPIPKSDLINNKSLIQNPGY